MENYIFTHKEIISGTINFIPMKKNILFLIALNLVVLSSSYAQTWKWAKEAGSWHNMDDAEAIATDKKGNVYVTGFVKGAYLIAGTDTLRNNWSFFLIKYDSLGNVLWTKNPEAWGGSWLAYAHAVTTDKDDNVYITGEYHCINLIFDATTTLIGAGSGP